MVVKFESQSFAKRLKSMLKVDFRRMLTMPLFYLMIGISVVVPVLILVMTTMMDGTVSVDPTTGVETVMEGFKNTWQAIGTVSSEGSAMSMDLTGMCNINMMYFAAAVFVCLFVAEDFRSGYAKNLFTVRPNKLDYVISKTLVGFTCGAGMIIGWVIGAVIGGAISGLPFELGTAGVGGLVMCIISKIFLMLIFVAISLAVAVAAKQKAWLSICCSLGGGMLLFTMIPMLTPLDSGIMNVMLCLAGGVMFSIGLGAVSNIILKKTALV